MKVCYHIKGSFGENVLEMLIKGKNGRVFILLFTVRILSVSKNYFLGKTVN